jgi:hypothetical protein
MATPTIKAIETEYAGCRFRSRLEARWAVFFDQLGIQWQYEVEGLELADGTRYLPDFVLPKYRTYVEVKGGDDALAADLSRLQRFAAEVGRLLVLGEVPNVSDRDEVPVHHLMLWDAGVIERPAIFVRTRSEGWVPAPIGMSKPTVTTASRYLNGVRIAEDVRAAYASARRARFEFGERG